MILLLNNKAKLVKYAITFIRDGELIEEFYTSKEANLEMEDSLRGLDIQFESRVIPQEGNEWIDGLEFDSIDEALKIFNKGEQAYIQEKQRQELTDNLRLRADIDYLAIMSEVEI